MNIKEIYELARTSHSFSEFENKIAKRIFSAPETCDSSNQTDLLSLHAYPPDIIVSHARNMVIKELERVSKVVSKANIIIGLELSETLEDRIKELKQE